MTIVPYRLKPRMNRVFFKALKKKKDFRKKQDKLKLLAMCYEMVGQDEKILYYNNKIEQKQLLGGNVWTRKEAQERPGIQLVSKRGREGSPYLFLVCQS